MVQQLPPPTKIIFLNPIKEYNMDPVERLENACCKDCLYYYTQECRRHAPEATIEPDDPARRIYTLWPRVQEDDWCGEFHPDGTEPIE